MNEDDEDCEIGEAFLRFMVEVAREAPSGTDPLTRADRLRERLRAHPRRAEFEDHLAAVHAKLAAADEHHDMAFFGLLLNTAH
jgi:hypothetical protein